MKNICSLIVCLIAFSGCAQKNLSSEEIKKKQEAIIEEYVANCAEKYSYSTQMYKWQECLDEGLKKDSTVAYLWQQKAMPYFKARKYEVGMKYIDKAVKYNASRWQPYRAFIKCIFAKTYKDAIADFEDCKKKFGNNYEMDHTYNFYIALCYLQLNEFEKAEVLLKEYIDEMLKKNGEEWVHPTALFYYGIAKFEQKKFNDAAPEFDRALKLYPHFSDAKYYKAICYLTLGRQDEGKKLLEEAKADAKAGYTINEDNVVYEKYPYQVRW